MEAFAWNSKYLTGVAVVDAQHERLVGLVNAFSELNARKADIQGHELQAVLDDLSAYALSHFVDEERLMRERKLDHRFISDHTKQHHRFIREVEHLHSSRFLDGHDDASRLLLRFLLHWLAFHILGIDMQMARQMYRIQLGASPAEAYEAEAETVDASDSTKLLLGAVDDLLRVLAERNLTLREANLTLEQRVAERTRELEASNAQLKATVETLRATQARLVESEKLASVGQLASGVAHEINNPLGFVGSNVGTLGRHLEGLLGLVDAYRAQEAALPEERRADLERARRAADFDFVREDAGQLLKETQEGLRRVQAVVRDLKDFSRVDDETVAETDLNHSVEVTLRVLTASAAEGIVVRHRPTAVPPLECYAALVNQALMSLLLNAVQAVADREDHAGTITVTTGVEGECAFVEVADDGVGMTEEVLAHAFEPFFTTRPVGRGVGLGLWTAWSCAERHRGRLDAISSPGAGTTMRLSLPLSRRASEPGAP